MARVTKRWRVQRRNPDGGRQERADALAGEEPLEIRLHGTPFTVTMRTPGHDFELVAGLLLSEGIITAHSEITTMDYRAGLSAGGQRDYNVIDVHLATGAPEVGNGVHRHVYTSSSCGICGVSSIDAVRKTPGHDVSNDTHSHRLAQLLQLPERLLSGQRIFGRTGGVHAAAVFRADHDGELVTAVLREDVGRHNAVDKAVGHAMADGGLPLPASVLQLSGRASFELVQKAAMAGIATLSAVSAPSGMAVELGEELGLTVIGFNRGDRLNIYTHPERVAD